MDRTLFQDLSLNSRDFFSITFLSLEISILLFQDFSTTVRALHSISIKLLFFCANAKPKINTWKVQVMNTGSPDLTKPL